MLGLTLKSKYLILKRELKEAELDAKYWKKMLDIEFNKRLNTINELAKKERRIEELEKQQRKLTNKLDKADDEVLDLKLERDMYKEEHEKVRQKYIDKDVELQIVDRIVLQYEQRINELEEQLNELTPK